MEVQIHEQLSGMFPIQKDLRKPRGTETEWDYIDNVNVLDENKLLYYIEVQSNFASHQ